MSGRISIEARGSSFKAWMMSMKENIKGENMLSKKTSNSDESKLKKDVDYINCKSSISGFRI